MTQTPELLQTVTTLFTSTWADRPESIASAPGRVNLIGEHTDYNDGFVLPMAIDRRTWAAVGASPTPGVVELVSTSHPETLCVNGPPWKPVANDSWANYVIGVVDGIERHAGLTADPLRIAVTSDVPMGAGLSSSAALEAAVAHAVAQYLGVSIEPGDMARICQRAEHEFAGVRCGIMDQMSSIMGNAVLLDCRTLEVATMTLPEDVRVVILDSGIPRGLSQSAYNERRSQCEEGVAVLQQRNQSITALRDVSFSDLDAAQSLMPYTVYRRCRHVVTENERVLNAAHALREGEMATFGTLMQQSHESMRDDYEISVPEIDRFVEIATAAKGCYGARLTGAGFGGAVVALVTENDAEAFASEVIQQYIHQTGRPGKPLLVSADAGARMER